MVIEAASYPFSILLSFISLSLSLSISQFILHLPAIQCILVIWIKSQVTLIADLTPKWPQNENVHLFCSTLFCAFSLSLSFSSVHSVLTFNLRQLPCPIMRPSQVHCLASLFPLTLRTRAPSRVPWFVVFFLSLSSLLYSQGLFLPLFVCVCFLLVSLICQSAKDVGEWKMESVMQSTPDGPENQRQEERRDSSQGRRRRRRRKSIKYKKKSETVEAESSQVVLFLTLVLD